MVCHNDPSPCNYVFVDGRPAVSIDFDRAAPRRPAARCRLRRLAVDHLRRRRTVPVEQARRLGLMADAYGLPDTSVPLDAVLLRQEENHAAALARSQSPDPAVAE